MSKIIAAVATTLFAASAFAATPAHTPASGAAVHHTTTKKAKAHKKHTAAKKHAAAHKQA